MSPRSRIVQVILEEPGARLAPHPVHPWSAYTDSIAAVAAERGNWLVDLRQFIPVGGDPAGAGLFLPDNVHLTAAGHRVFAAAMWTLLWTHT